MDLEVLSEGLKYILKVVQTPPFSDLVEVQLAPGPNVDLSTDEKVKGKRVLGSCFAHPLTMHMCRICQEQHVDDLA